MQRLLFGLTVMGTLVYGVSGEHSYGSVRFATGLATESAFVKVHGSHQDCKLGSGLPGWQPNWHKHPYNMFMSTFCQPPEPPLTTKKGTIGPKSYNDHFPAGPRKASSDTVKN
jgi:hypothetical protein